MLHWVQYSRDHHYMRRRSKGKTATCCRPKEKGHYTRRLQFQEVKREAKRKEIHYSNVNLLTNIVNKVSHKHENMRSGQRYTSEAAIAYEHNNVHNATRTRILTQKQSINTETVSRRTFTDETGNPPRNSGFQEGRKSKWCWTVAGTETNVSISDLWNPPNGWIAMARGQKRAKCDGHIVNAQIFWWTVRPRTIPYRLPPKLTESSVASWT